MASLSLTMAAPLPRRCCSSGQSNNRSRSPRCRWLCCVAVDEAEAVHADVRDGDSLVREEGHEGARHEEGGGNLGPGRGGSTVGRAVHGRPLSARAAPRHVWRSTEPTHAAGDDVRGGRAVVRRGRSFLEKDTV